MIGRRSARRAGRPGLLGMAARTAVVAGTATAVAGNVQRNQQANAQQQQEAAAFREQQEWERAQALAQQAAAQQAAAAPAAAPAAVPAPPALNTDELIRQLQQLGELKAQGVLTEAEFDAQKARLLGG